MKHWFKDRQMRLLLRNSSYLGISQVVSAIAGIVSVAFTGRALGVLMFGMLVLVNSYAQAASGISKFQSWQLVVRYGGKALAAGDPQEFKEATSFAFGLDIISGIGGMLAALALLPLLSHTFGIPDRYVGAAMLYCTLLPTMAAATPTGVLRALKRFDLISWQGCISPIARAVLTGIAWANEAPFETFLLIWYVTSLGGDLLLWFLAGRELKRQGMLKGIRPILKPRTLPGAWRFALHVNLNTTLGAGSGPITRLIVGSYLGPAGAALYRVASNISDAIKKPADLILKAYYPQIVSMDLKTKEPWKLMARIVILSGIVAVVAALLLLLGGKLLIMAIFGHKFLGAYEPLLILCISPVLGMLSFPMAPMFFTLDRPDIPVHARLAGTVVLFLSIIPMTTTFGLIGAAAASVIGSVVTVVIMSVRLRQEYRRVRSPRTASPAGG